MIKEFDRNELWIVLVASMLLILSVFVNLGIYPLYLEEPRRALIALEMIFNDNIWVPTEFGEFYYKKPPLFNWVIIMGFKLFDGYSEFAVRFFSVIAYLLMGVVTFFAGRKYVSMTFGIYAAFLFLISSDLLFYFTITSGEIDLVYSFLTFLSFICLYYFYNKRQFYALFLSFYFLGALGTLTKGLPSPVFIAISLLAFSILFVKDIKFLISKYHLSGILLYILIIGGYFYVYSLYNSPINYFKSEDSLVTQSMERTIFDNGLLDVVLGIFTFPFLLLKILAPVSLLSIFLIKKNILATLEKNQFVWFCFIIFSANIMIYWISPGTASRYLYMFFPLVAIFLFYPFYINAHVPSIGMRYLEWFFGIVIIVLIIACISLPFIPRLDILPGRLMVSACGVGVFTALTVAYKRCRR